MRLSCSVMVRSRSRTSSSMSRVSCSALLVRLSFWPPRSRTLVDSRWEGEPRQTTLPRPTAGTRAPDPRRSPPRFRRPALYSAPSASQARGPPPRTSCPTARSPRGRRSVAAPARLGGRKRDRNATTPRSGARPARGPPWQPQGEAEGRPRTRTMKRSLSLNSIVIDSSSWNLRAWVRESSEETRRWYLAASVRGGAPPAAVGLHPPLLPLGRLRLLGAELALCLLPQLVDSDDLPLHACSLLRGAGVSAERSPPLGRTHRRRPRPHAGARW